MDNRSADLRSRNMANIHSNDTKPEIIVRLFLYHHGYRYRKNVSKLPGKPDIVLGKYKTVVFVNGCFWHAHQGCSWFVPPKTNQEFWNKKFEYNISRDKANYEKLKSLGWNVIVVWECEIRHGNAEKRLQELVDKIQQSNKK